MKKIRRLANNQIVVCENVNYQQCRYEFYSYGTLIATYYSDCKGKQKIELTSYYDYSKTTSKYLKVFLQDYCSFYYKDTKELKKLINEGGDSDVIIQVI